jgi:hypothetical protein
MTRVAALYVAKNGPYFGLEGVDPWDEERDARKYAGPYPVVAHPPCERWGRYWSGGPNPAAERRRMGDDGGCFAHALYAARTFGGVIEHPAHSLAWDWFGLIEPPMLGWSVKDRFGGRSAQVYQGHYGHRAAKATWLYYVGEATPPELKWGPVESKVRLEDGFHSSEERARARCRNHADSADLGAGADPHAGAVSRSIASNRRARAIGLTACEFLSRRQRAATPREFRDVLIGIAKVSSSSTTRARSVGPLRK